MNLPVPGADGLPAASRTRVRAIPWGALGLLASLPFLLALFSDAWPYTPTQSAFIDPWLYPSFFLHMKAQLLAFPWAYYGDRLSDTLPGWCIYRIFGPWLGNYVFKLSVIYTATFALFFAVRQVFHERAALLAVLLLLAEPFFVIAFGWDYVDGIGVAYFSLTLLCLVRAADSDRYRLSLFLAGVFGVCLITSHLLWMNVAWTLPLGYFLANRMGRRHSAWISLAMLLCGSVAALGFFTAVYHGLTGKWFYLENSVHVIRLGVAGAKTVVTPFSEWFYGSSWLVQYNALAPAAAWLALRRRTGGMERLYLSLFLATYLTCWAWQAAGFPFAALWYYTSFLFPWFAMALGACLHRALAAMDRRTYSLLVAACVAGSGLVIWGGGLATEVVRADAGSPAGVWVWNRPMVPLSLLGAAVALPLAAIARARRWPAAVFTFGLLFVFAAQFGVARGWFTQATDLSNKQGFRMVLDADAWADRLTTGRHLFWWYDKSEPRQGIIFGITSLYFRATSMVNDDLPNLRPEDEDRITTRPVISLSWKPDALGRVRSALRRYWFSVQPLDNTAIRSGGATLYLNLFRVGRTESDVDGLLAQRNAREITGFLRPDELRPTAGVRMDGDTSVRLRYTGPQWDYAAELPFDLKSSAGEAWIRIRAKVIQGKIALGVTNASDSDFEDRVILDPGRDDQEIVLRIRHPETRHTLIIGNGLWSGRPSEIVIERLAVYTPAESGRKGGK